MSLRPCMRRLRDASEMHPCQLGCPLPERTPSRHIDNSISVYLFLEFEPQLDKSEEFSNHGMKEIELLEAIPFLSPKKHQAGFAWNFLETPIQVCRGASILYFNTLFFFFFVNPCFLRMSQPPGQNQQNGKQFWLLRLPFKISFKNTSFHIFINSLGIYFSPECLLNFLSNLYRLIFHHVWEK